MIMSSAQKINILIKHKLLTRDKSYLFISDDITEKMTSALKAVLINNSEAISFVNFSS